MEPLKAFILFILVSHSKTFKVDRKERDSTHGYTQCSGFDRTVGEGWFWNTCTCLEEYTTMMSIDKKEYNCFTLKEIGCEYNLQDSPQAYLIKESDILEEIIPRNNSKSISISRILLWNYDLYTGHWLDITFFASKYFTVNNQNSTSLNISNLDLKRWGGHVVKIDFDDKKCLAMKVQGTTVYPYKLEEFTRKFLPPNTTMPATTTVVKPTTSKPMETTSSKTKPTVLKSTTKKPTVKIITTETPIVTTSTQTTKRRKLETPKMTISVTSKKSLSTTVSTAPSTMVTINITGAPLRSSSKGDTATIVLPIIIVIFIALIIALVYERRKTTKKSSKNENEVKDVNEVKVSNMYPDISMVNNSYEPELYVNNVAKDDNDCTKADGATHEGYEEVDLNVSREGVDTETERLQNGVENPSYMDNYIELDSDIDNKDSPGSKENV